MNASICRKNSIFAAKSLPPFGTYTETKRRSPTCAVTMRVSTSKAGWLKLRLVSKCVAPDVQPHARVSARAVPVTAISLQLAERRRHLSHGRFELLQADHVRPLALDPFKNLSLRARIPLTFQVAILALAKL